MAEVEKFLFSRKEAALSLGISLRSIAYLIAGGKLETKRIGKKVLIPRESLRLFARSNHTDSVSTASTLTAA
jgi:excisionase family DNA binding protein